VFSAYCFLVDGTGLKDKIVVQFLKKIKRVFVFVVFRFLFYFCSF